MLPYGNGEENQMQVGRKVYINPDFPVVAQAVTQQQQALAHQGHFANQSVMHTAQPAIHINPQYFQRQFARYYLEMQLAQAQQQPILINNNAPADVPTPAKIISKASTCIVRNARPATVPKVDVVAIRDKAPLVSLSKCKLVRRNPKTNPAISSTIPTTTRSKLIQSSTPAKRTKYKLVRAISLTSTTTTPLVKKRRTREFVGRYALSRSNTGEASNKLSLKPYALKPSVNKSLKVVSIHGVLYKKTDKNKLTKLDATTGTITSKTVPRHSRTAGRTLFVRGTKFELDPTGCRLTRMPIKSYTTTNSPQSTTSRTILRRIDIGGLTYVASPKTQNVYIRNTNHVSRAHLMSARQRSLLFLNRPLVKTNVPCPIFQRLGKCAAHSRGKCFKLHDKRQVSICQRFLRGECTKNDCLLSHNVTLEKMPVCRYYLRGACAREDCPYLHKKLSVKAEVCIDFLRGFCARAAECNKRHEFVCPEFTRKGKCEVTNCTYCIKAKKTENAAKKKKLVSLLKEKAKPVDTPKKQNPETEKQEPTLSRYFKCTDVADTKSFKVGDNTDIDDEPTTESVEDSNETFPTYSRRRPKLGELPAFIPFD